MLGIIDTRYIDLGSTIDADYLRSLQTRSGLSMASLVQRLDAAVGAINDTDDPLVSMLVSRTTERTVPVRGNRRFVPTRRSEQSVPRPQFTSGGEYMLPIDDWDVSLGFTEDGLEEISLPHFDEQLDGMTGGWEHLHRTLVLQRLFDAADIPVRRGSTIMSPGFAGSSGAYAGFYPNGDPLPGGYTHYLVDTTANLSAMIKTAIAKLSKWHQPPYDLIGSQAVVDAITALSGGVFVDAGSPLIRPGQGTAEAVVDASTYVGVIHKKVRVMMPITDFTDLNFAVVKSYGAGSPQNPLKWVWDDLKGQDIVVKSRSLYPLHLAISQQRFGIGVGDQLSAVVCQVDDTPGTYTAPTLVL